jgi:hypothetical protein
MNRHRYLLLVGILSLATLPALGAPSSKGPAIKKCQDTTGKWHYGDNAADACAQSKVTVINEQGMTKKEIAAPLTAQELKQREQNKAERERAEEQAKEQARQEQLLLGTYANEADIAFIRDRKLANIEAAIKTSQENLTQLRAVLARLEAQAASETKANKAVLENTTDAINRTQSQIAQQEAVMAQWRQEQEAIKTRAASDLQRYRDAKAKPTAAAVAPTKKP